MDYKKVEKYSLHLYIVGISLLILTSLWGYELNGVKRWLSIGPFQLEAVASASPLIMISYVGLAKKWCRRGKSGAILLFVLMILPIMFYIRGYFAQGIIIYSVLLGVFYKHYPNCLKPASNKKYNIIFWITTLGIAITFFVKQIIEVPYRLERIKIWLNPSIDPMGDGWLMMHLRNMCKGASLIGNKGLIYSLEQCDAREMLLPYGSMGLTDYILNFIIGVLGILPAIILVLVIIGFLIRCFKTVAQVREDYGHHLLMSMSIWFSIQFILSVLSNLGLLPITTGAYIPFVSYGGSNLVCNMMLIGLFLGIYRRKDINPVQLISENSADDRMPKWMQRINAFFEIETHEIDEAFAEEFEGELNNRAVAEATLDFLKNCEEVESIEVVFKK